MNTIYQLLFELWPMAENVWQTDGQMRPKTRVAVWLLWAEVTKKVAIYPWSHFQILDPYIVSQMQKTPWYNASVNIDEKASSVNQVLSTQKQGYHTRALNGSDSGAWQGLIWAGSGITAIHTQWQMTFAPSAASRRVSWPHPHGLAGKSRCFKTISFVLYTFLYVTYTTPLAIILHTIDSQ